MAGLADMITFRMDEIVGRALWYDLVEAIARAERGSECYDEQVTATARHSVIASKAQRIRLAHLLEALSRRSQFAHWPAAMSDGAKAGKRKSKTANNGARSVDEWPGHETML
jgi:hypothetical protein